MTKLQIENITLYKTAPEAFMNANAKPGIVLDSLVYAAHLTIYRT